MMHFRYKKAFLKEFESLNHLEKNLVIAADKQIRNYYLSHDAPYGLRIKKLYAEGGDKIFEARVSDKIRILWVESEGLVSFTMVGDHDEIKRYLRSLN